MHTAKHKYANTRSSENNNTLSHWVGGRWQDGIRIKGPASRLTDGFGFIEDNLQWFSFTRLYVASSNCTDWHRKWGNKSCRDYLFIDEVTLLWCCRPLHDHCTGHLLQCQPLAGGPKTWDGWQWKQKQNREQNTGKAQRSGDINVYGFFDVCRGRLWIFITGIPLQQDIYVMTLGLQNPITLAASQFHCLWFGRAPESQCEETLTCWTQDSLHFFFCYSA